MNPIIIKKKFGMTTQVQTDPWFPFLFCIRPVTSTFEAAPDLLISSAGSANWGRKKRNRTKKSLK